ncbi:M64 family metallopeptidase [Kitasatospora sp. NBC_01287]|uniref:M64 family metallopeptidase n=1 Tax=Kitasatospora sp. NBC_01287 TaxID=2903573 RepID=UPI00225B6C6D|nr:M64 family metallopeptidase [Kitasatospora sp. NBC_01287]MCX4747605.1 M64 family metallopeptidase [Kitasatospora sp. NBC_01287]
MTPGNPGRLIRSLAALALLAAAVLPAALELTGPAPFAVIGPAANSLTDRAAPPRGGSAVQPARLRTGTAPTVDIRRTGDPANRITLVLLGDGYAASQQELFRQQADQAWRALMEIEPFRTYQDFFNIRRVEVVSPTAGIAETQGRGKRPGTPLGMHFWCEGTARLLCADEAATAQYAGPGEGPQYLIALANSTEYGGAGGTGVTTLAGGSPDAGRIIQHEIGHTVGDLGDEYDSAPKDADYPNLSTQGADAMRRDHLKWWRWLGSDSPDGGGQVGAYRSANGIYRPTTDSVMRTLGGSYNLPSREAIIEQLYRRLSPVDGVEPAAGRVVGQPRLTVRPLHLTGSRQLQVDWKVDGRPVQPGSADRTWFDPATLALAPGQRVTVTATVRDTTDWVRDEAYRDQHMTRAVSWVVTG